MASIHADNGTDVNSTDSINTYANLSSQIEDAEEGSTLNLSQNYRYDPSNDTDLADGVRISKSIRIVGEDNSCIDGSHLARGFYIEKNCSVILENLTFKNAYSKSSGAAIYLADNSNLTLINCIFMDNMAYNSDGGAINAQTSTNVYVHNCTFDNNTSVRESNLEWAKFKCGMGSAICVHIGSNLELYESILKNNNAYMATVLVISYDDVRYKLSSLFVKGCLFEKNTGYNCGIIYLDELGKGEILDSVFKSNNVTHAGGILELDACKSCTVKNCKFESNYGHSGGAIKIKVFNSKYRSHVNIINCDFTKNTAATYGGAIRSKYGVVEISNCNFNQNTAVKDGGAIYSELDSIKISNCNFNQNTARNGGGLYLDSKGSSVINSLFSKNTAKSNGGAVYSTTDVVKVSGIKYSSNNAKVSSKVYGAFYAKVKQYTYTSKSVKLKVKITSPWKLPVSQKIQVKLKGPKKFTSKWVKADSNGIVKVIVPFNVKISKYKLTISMKNDVCSVKSWTKVKDNAKIYCPKTVEKPNKIKVTIKNKASKALIKKTKFNVKVYTGKTYKSYKLKTNSKGVLKISTAKLTKGTHKITVLLSNGNYDINNKFKVKIK
jgi:predicted outer membrane repeat protein